ncbi:DUF2293 domain-containing protein [bacterium]|nr:DUF2293 domain-containing protein [bacterium]
MLVVITHIIYTEMNYDELLMQGMDRSSAHEEVNDVIDKVLELWT